MEKLYIEPHIGIGLVELNMTRNEVHEVMGHNFESFYKFKESLVDGYYSSCFQVFYSKDNEVEYIEISKDITKKYDVRYNQIKVFDTIANDLIKQIADQTPYDPNNPENPYSYIFKGTDLNLWRQDSEEPYFDTIGIGIKGYYSNV